MEITGIEKKDSIDVKTIDGTHIVVGVDGNGHPYILGKPIYREDHDYRFYSLSGGITILGGNSLSQKPSIEESISGFLAHDLGLKRKVEAFHYSDWKKALQWLIDNGSEPKD